jgi:hypothetical protein
MLESNRSEIDSLCQSSIRWPSCSTARRPSRTAATSALPPLQGLAVGGEPHPVVRAAAAGAAGVHGIDDASGIGAGN